jgi:hypothetical protein
MRLFLELDLANRDRVPAAVPTMALDWVPDAPSGPDAWRIDSNWRGPGVLVLNRLPGRP